MVSDKRRCRLELVRQSDAFTFGFSVAAELPFFFFLLSVFFLYKTDGGCVLSL